MEVRCVFWIPFFFWFSVTSAIVFDKRDQETTTENYDVAFPTTTTTTTTTEKVLEQPSDNGMVIGTIQEEPIQTSISPTAAEGKEEEIPSAVEVQPIVAFPENHKNFTPSEYIGDSDYPPYYNHLSEYQQQYQNYHEQKEMYSKKPLKFEENSTKNLYLPLNGNFVPETQDVKNSEVQHVIHKPFPYVFESENVPENWHKNTGSRQVANSPYLVEDHNRHVSPYYFFPYKHLQQNRYYKQELVNEHHDVIPKEKVDPWKKVFKILTALVPLGLFLATLTPNVISINGTTNAKTTKQSRTSDPLPLRFKEEDVFRLLKEYGVESLSESQCEDRVICELATKGEEISANSIERGFWFLANETPWDVAEKAGMTELFEAIKAKKCEMYKCHSQGKAKRSNDFGKKFTRKRIIAK